MSINDGRSCASFVVGRTRWCGDGAAGAMHDEIMAALDVRPTLNEDGMRRRSTRLSVLVKTTGRAGPGRRALSPARLQHRLARGRAHRGGESPGSPSSSMWSRTARAGHQQLTSSSTSSDRRAGAPHAVEAGAAAGSRFAPNGQSQPRARGPRSSSGPDRGRAVELVTIEATGTADKLDGCSGCWSRLASRRWCSPAWWGRPVRDRSLVPPTYDGRTQRIVKRSHRSSTALRIALIQQLERTKGLPRYFTTTMPISRSSRIARSPSSVRKPGARPRAVAARLGASTYVSASKRAPRAARSGGGRAAGADPAEASAEQTWSAFSTRHRCSSRSYAEDIAPNLRTATRSS